MVKFFGTAVASLTIPLNGASTWTLLKPEQLLDLLRQKLNFLSLDAIEGDINARWNTLIDGLSISNLAPRFKDFATGIAADFKDNLKGKPEDPPVAVEYNFSIENVGSLVIPGRVLLPSK